MAVRSACSVGELALRVLTGGALVLSAPRLAFSHALTIFGWVLIGSSLALAVVPWRLHHRLAAWSVPQNTRHMPPIGIASIAGGLFLLGMVLLPRAGSRQREQAVAGA